MDSTDLGFFLAVANAGGIGRAAHDLHTVQSNVTQRIRGLERELGAQLFHRSKRGVTLTAMGGRLLPYALRIHELLDEVRRVVRDEAAPGGELRIGSLETTAALRLPPILTAYTDRCPAVDLQIESGPTEPLIESVLARRLDGAFVAGPVAHADLEALPVVEEELVLVTPPQIRTPRQVTEYFASNGNRKVIVFRAGCSYRQRTLEYLAREGFVDVRRMEMGTLDGIIGCIAAGLGVSLLPRAVVAAAEHQGRVHAHTLPAGIAKAVTMFVHRKDSFVSSALRLFIDCAQGEPLPVPTRRPLPEAPFDDPAQASIKALVPAQ
ncbi:MAG TPA: LysR substrate-binding domain-containing protein [Stellaceae bacterium]|jgi:DNA-binding transcriptional LysR family regulator|nr:LysR substrate-binding domain-containing protein [Stellaceae bacterium]